jgi:hypothetical protein
VTEGREVRITQAMMSAIPLPAAWLDEQGSVMAATPEWGGAALGVREYRAGWGGRLRLLVAPRTHAPGIAALSARLLRELEQAVGETPPPRGVGLRLALAALGVMVGRGDPEELRLEEVAEAVVAASRLESRAPAVRVAAAGEGGQPVVGGWLIAAALKQMVMNAARHEQSREVWLSLRGEWMAVGWEVDASRAAPGVATSRHRELRSGWGLGMVRLCCDAIGASFLAPRRRGGMVEGALVLEPESACLRLPLAAVGADGVVIQATRTWDAEAGVAPGRRVTDRQIAALVAAAREKPGRIVESGPWTARSDKHVVWVALRPADTREQGLDLLEGVAHEAQLLVGDSQSGAWRRAVAVLEALQLAVGQAAPGYAEADFHRDLVRFGEAFGTDLSWVSGVTTPTPPPALTAFLLAEGGGGQVERDGGAWIVRPASREAPELTALCGPGGGIRVPLADEVIAQEVMT